MGKIKILHLTCTKELGSGQKKQLVYEFEAAKKITEYTWDVVSINSVDITEPFQVKPPKWMQSRILRDLYSWVYIIKNRNCYDFILMRYVPADPWVVIFSPFLKNLFPVHHSVEIDERKLVSSGLNLKIFTMIEVISSTVSTYFSKGIVSVTNEINKYHTRRIDNKRVYLYPNGVKINDFEILKNNQRIDSINMVFMCTEFYSWHGLEKLIHAAKLYRNKYTQMPINIYLIGNITSLQRQSIKDLNLIDLSFVECGVLTESAYLDIMSTCDIGIGSLALELKSLKEAATLKVREYAASGLPIFATHKDVSFPESYAFYKFDEAVDLDEIVRFALVMKTSAKREDVRASAYEYIDKQKIMMKIAYQLSS